MALPKMGGKKVTKSMKELKKKKLSCPQYFYNIFTINHTWLVIVSSKKFGQTNCDNDIAKIGRKKKICENLIVAMPLPK